MKAQEFVLKVKTIAPIVDDYINNGYSKKLANENVKSFFIKEKKSYSRFEDELLRLVDCFEVNSIAIGMVKFSEDIEIKNDFYIIGQVEADWLVVDKVLGVVKVVELFSCKDLWTCSINGAYFLDAIFEVKKFITSTSLNINWKDEQNDLCAISEEFGIIAGGKEYIEFYKMLIGCFE
jgi:hypothetical protein